jgi:hypothetical protein
MSIRNKDFYAEDYMRLETELEAVKAERDELKRQLANVTSAYNTECLSRQRLLTKLDRLRGYDREGDAVE